MSNLEVRHVAMSDPLVLPLIEDLVREYTSRYGFLYEDLLSYPPARFAPPDGAFILLIEDGEAVAGGAFQRHDPGTAEVKRVWTHRDHRRRGLARRVMAELEKEAAGRGYSRIYLTTGPNQPEAVGMYLAGGYTALFDLTSPPTDGPLPFEKRLTSTDS
ncbi:MAG: GNAT family N-acetyltransferase [Kibdelosporangium sp.]